MTENKEVEPETPIETPPLVETPSSIGSIEPSSDLETESLKEPLVEVPLTETTTKSKKIKEKSIVPNGNECPPWYKDSLLVLIVSLLAICLLIFFILFVTKSANPTTPNKNPTKPNEPGSPGSPPGSPAPGCPECPPQQSCPKPEQVSCACDCAKCKEFTWELLQNGMGQTEFGDIGYPVEISSDTDTLEGAQEWVSKKRAIALTYPIHPCVRSKCHETNGGHLSSNTFFYSYMPYVQSIPDQKYQCFVHKTKQ